MAEIINIYCDESCHLQNDRIKPMALGAIHVPKNRVAEVNRRINEIKKKHNFDNSELKWIKVSSSNQMYIEIINYFFDTDIIRFRGLVIPDKTKLNHSEYSQTHDEWYYKMFFQVLNPILSEEKMYHIYLDYKDTNGGKRIKKLEDVLCNANYDFNHEIINKIQLVKSHQTPIMQITDILIGALTYYYRNSFNNKGKIELIDLIKIRSGHSLNYSTLLADTKFNLFIWQPRCEVLND